MGPLALAAAIGFTNACKNKNKPRNVNDGGGGKSINIFHTTECMKSILLTIKSKCRILSSDEAWEKLSSYSAT